MKKLFLVILSALLFSNINVVADTQLIKYKKYLIPVDIKETLEVVSSPATQISSASATLNLQLISGEPNIKVWFENSQSSQPACASVAPGYASSLSSGQSYQYNQLGLAPRTTYYFRACAENDQGDSSAGAILTYQTDEAATIVETVAASSIAQTSAQLNGDITSGTYITTWFVYSQNNAINCVSPVAPSQSNGNTGDAISQTLTDLLPNTTYYFRFCGVGSDGTKSGQVLSFVTPPDPTSIVFASVSGRTDSGATFTSTLQAGQQVTTWYVVRESNLSPTCNGTRRNETVLQAGQDNVYVASDLDDWESYNVTFCAEDINGNIESVTRNFSTLRQSGKEYVVWCDDNRTYSSVNGPLRFYVVTPEPVFPQDDHATFTIDNQGGPRTIFRQGRTTSANVSIPSGVYGPVAIDPDFPPFGSEISDRFYRLRIFGSEPWEATVGCITENIFNLQAEQEEGGEL